MTVSKQAWRNRIVGHGDEPLDGILFNPSNWRIHPKAQQQALEGVLSEVGWVQDVILNRVTGRLVDGHLRCQVAARNGETTIPVVYVELTEEEEALVLATIDPIASMAATDKAKLDELYQQVKTEDDRVRQMMSEMAEREGLEWGKVDKPDDPGAQIDKAEELREKWGVELGQLWRLGEHRLICGDCTDRAVVDRLMEGEKAALFATDPPYGVNYSELRNSQAEMRRTTVEYEDISADKMNGPDLQKFLESCFSVWLPRLNNNAAWYLWHAQLTQGFFAAAAAAADILIHRQIIWVKPSFIFGRGDYHWKHELCFYGWRRGNRPPFYGEHNQDTVWNFNGGGSSGGTHKDHPTQKPVELWEIPINNHTKAGEICAEPFSGSGTAIIACERLGRKCRAVEISPAYVSVTLERFYQMTNIMPELIG